MFLTDRRARPSVALVDVDPATGRVLASKVRIGDWLLVDGYVREVVRVEIITAKPGPASHTSNTGDREHRRDT